MKSAESGIKRITSREDKLNILSGLLQTLKDDGFTGYIKINFTQGSIGRVEKFEEILKRN